MRRKLSEKFTTEELQEFIQDSPSVGHGMRNYDILIISSDTSEDIIPVHASTPASAISTAIMVVQSDWIFEALMEIVAIKVIQKKQKIKRERL